MTEGHNYMASDGLRAADCGYHVLPIVAGDKVPGRWFNGTWTEEADWARFCERPATELELDLWAKWPECSVSLAGGPVVGVDIDIDDHALAYKVRDVAERVLGKTPLVRFGRRPRMMLVYRAAVPFQSWNVGPIQVIARGRQFVAYGIHPVTKQPYAWEDDTPAETDIASLPQVTEERVRLFATEALKVLPLAMRQTKARAERVGCGASEPATREAVASALAMIPSDATTCYDDWIQVGMSIHAGLGEAGEDLWHDWSSRDPRYDQGEAAGKWRSFGGRSGANAIGPGTVFALARERGWALPAGLHLTQREAELAKLPHPAQALLDRIARREVCQPKSEGAALPLEFFEDIQASVTALWSIKGFLPQRALALIYGKPGGGKSFLAIDMALHLATGREWMGRGVSQAGVVYVAAEGQGGLRRRAVAFRQHHGLSGAVPFALVPCAVDLLNPQADVGRLVEAIRGAAARFGAPPGWIVIDTLSRTFGGGDENTKDMAAYVANLGAVQEATGAGVLLIHHKPKSVENKTPRGHGSLLGAVDTCIAIEGDGPIKSATVEKQKDAEEGEPIKFQLYPVEVGQDEEGQPVTSCVVIRAAEIGGELAARAGLGAKIGGPQRVTLKVLEQLVAEQGVAPGSVLVEGVVPATVQLVARLDAWAERGAAALASPDQQPDSARRAFHRARQKLQESGMIGVHDVWAWPR